MDLNYGGNVTPYNFSVPTGLGVNGNQYDFSSLNSFGLGSPTQGANAGGLSVPSGSSLTGATPQGFGLNIPTFQLGLSGISSLANLFTGLKALGLARDQFDFQKGITQKNLANSVASYNTALSDRATARGVTEGQSSQQVQDYINANKLSS